MIIDELMRIALQKAENLKVADVRAGLGYTGVLLEDNSCGLAYSFRNELGPCCGMVDEAGELIGKQCKDLILWAKDENLAKASIGVAAMNAVLHKDITDYDKKNFMDAIDIKPGETFGMIGNFHPIANKVSKMTDKIYIFERNGVEGKNIYPDWEIDKHLPKCDVVVITGTSIINKTIDHILENSKNAREIYILGPSTTMCPQVFKKYGVKALAGSIVTNPKKVLEVISQGGGTMAMKKYIDHVLIRVD